jgi:hypothetical protein
MNDRPLLRIETGSLSYKPLQLNFPELILLLSRQMADDRELIFSGVCYEIFQRCRQRSLVPCGPFFGALVNGSCLEKPTDEPEHQRHQTSHSDEEN